MSERLEILLVRKISVLHHEFLITNNPNIDIGGTQDSIRRLVTSAKRVTISNVSPSIPHDVIEMNFKHFGLQLASSVSFLRAGIPGD